MSAPCTARRLLPAAILLALWLAARAGASEDRFFWDEPQFLVPTQAFFPQARSAGDLFVVAWQEHRRVSADRISVHISLKVSSDGLQWYTRERVAGPIEYSGSEVSIFSLAVGNDGTIYLAVLQADASVRVLVSRDAGRSFSSNLLGTDAELTLAPKLSMSSDDGVFLFVTRRVPVGDGQSLALFYSRSRDGLRWEPFRRLTADEVGISLLPTHVNSGDTEYLVFQGREPQAPNLNYQLFLMRSVDRGASWSRPRPITVFPGFFNGSRVDAQNINNQRPDLLAEGGRLSLAWERRAEGGNWQIHALDLRAAAGDGGSSVTSGPRDYFFPQQIWHRGRMFVLYFTSRFDPRTNSSLESLIMSERDNEGWREIYTSDLPGRSLFGIPASVNGRLFLIWQNHRAADSRVVLLKPDLFAQPPGLAAENFTPGRRSRAATARFRWSPPSDISGIAGYAWQWTRQLEGAFDPQALPFLPAEERSMAVAAEEDGAWYFRLATKDRAGNWSSPAVLEYFRDTTPPGPVTFREPQTDEQGFLASNTFTLAWEPSDGEEAASYRYSLAFRAAPEQRTVREGPEVPFVYETSVTGRRQAAFNNLDDGVWVFSVQAADEVGNVGPASEMVFRLNKYVPVTFITVIDAERDMLGTFNLRIFGRGFLEGGAVSSVVLDREGQAPYDYVFTPAHGVFSVRSDRTIVGPAVGDILEGTYRVAVTHPTRGTVWAARALSLASSGTIKYGDYGAAYRPRLFPVQARVAFALPTLSVWLIVVFLGLALAFSGRRLAFAVREGREISREVRALLEGSALPYQLMDERIAMLKKRGMGLRRKITLFASVLVVAVVLMVSIPLAVNIIARQENILAEGLRSQAEVLLDSLVTGARTYLPDFGEERAGVDITEVALGLGSLPNQIEAMEDALYATIIGRGAQDPDRTDYIIATNDPDWAAGVVESMQVGLDAQTRFRDPGRYRVRPLPSVPGVLSDEELARELDETARRELAPVITDLAEVGRRVREVSLALARDSENAGLRAESEALSERAVELRRVLDEGLARIGDRFASHPPFDTADLDYQVTRYVFYKPILARSPDDDRFFRGFVRLGVSTENIIAQIRTSRNQLILLVAGTAVFALSLGILGALTLSSIIIIPIRKLAEAVKHIGDTEDKEHLKGYVVDINTRDELSTLADTVNEMTRGLVRAEAARKELTVGKDIQKMFLPLDRDSRKRKRSTGAGESALHEFFGYYEGATGVSGDYFDFRPLDGDAANATRYALIKCDVSGHGVSAALIMVEVATVFLNYFTALSGKNGGAERVDLPRLVSQINTLLVEREFSAMFAAMNVGTLDLAGGRLRLCNAGDTLFHQYVHARSRVVQTKLPEAPATGVFPTDLVEMRGGFKVTTVPVERGDILFFFTDGFEESKRLYRDALWRPYVITRQDIEEGRVGAEGSAEPGADNEELGLDRMRRIIEAVMHAGVFKLEKTLNPAGDEPIEFDFSGCTGTAREVVMALTAVEKIWRISPDPRAGSTDRVMVDLSVDEFLRKHFRQYSRYFAHPFAAGTLPGYEAYAHFTHLREDEQRDDLSIMAIRKK